MPTKHSGFLRKSSFGQTGNFEVVVASNRGGFVHFFRDNDSASLPWSTPQLFGSSSASMPSLLQHDDGHLEAIACAGGRLASYTRTVRWLGPKHFGSGLTGNPAVIQADGGQFHMVVPLAGGGFAEFQRANDPDADWASMQTFATDLGEAQAVALIQSNFDGNLEIAAVVGSGSASVLVHFWRSSFGVWHGPGPVALDGLPAGTAPQGLPAFLQSKHGSKGHFEIIVPLNTGGCAHVRRNNDSPTLEWQPISTFGAGQFSSVSVLQSDFGSPGLGNFELVGRVEDRVEHYWCDDQSLQWNGPTPIYEEPLPGNPALTGIWRVEYSCEPVGIHAALLHTDKILFFAYEEHDQSHGVSSVFNPADETVEHVHQDEDLFCSGHAFLSDGRLLVAGGHATGEKSLFLFEPAGSSGSWVQLPDFPVGRWYPTCTTLPDGSIFILSGAKQGGGGAVNDTYQIYHPATGLQDPHPATFLNELAPFNTYPWVFLIPSGKLCIFAFNKAFLFDLTTKTFGATPIKCIREEGRTYPLEGTGVLLPLVPDSNPPYRARVMVIGGGGLPPEPDTPATNACEILDLDDPQPAWKATPPMNAARVMPDAVLLPDGTVLVVNGSSAGKADNGKNPVFQVDLYDPKANTWKAMGETRIARLYHATALLLPDGTVMTAGTDEQFNPEPFHYPEYRLEIFYPPYLFRGPRPVIHAAPVSVSYGVEFEISCDNAASIESAAILRAGSVTHSFNMDQRYVGLEVVARTGQTITLRLPPNGNVAPPGYYLLFILNADGVPSESKFIQVS